MMIDHTEITRIIQGKIDHSKMYENILAGERNYTDAALHKYRAEEMQHLLGVVEALVEKKERKAFKPFQPTITGENTGPSKIIQTQA